MRAFILLSLCLLVVLEPREAFALGKMFSAFKSGPNNRAETEAQVPVGCTTGMCSGNPFRNGPIRSIPQENIASGVPRVLATIYGACDAARPLNSINMNARVRNGAYETYMAVGRSSDVVTSDQVFVPGLSNDSTRDVREISNSAQYNSGGPYAAASRGQMCSSQGFNVSAAPKSFGYGASGVMNSNGEYDILRCGRPSFFSRLNASQRARTCGLAPNSQPAIAIDCAEFIGAAAVASCKKLHKNQRLRTSGFEFPVDGNRRELSTASMVDSARSGSSNSCLTNTPAIGPNASIQAGDIFAGAGEHSLMITKVGPDPLGINTAKNRPGGCDSLTYADLDFDMAHSPSHAAIGPINSTATAYVSMMDGANRSNPYPVNRILDMAVLMCNRQTRGSAQSFIEDPSFSLLRHKGGPECSYPPSECPKLAGDECADQCGV